MTCKYSEQDIALYVEGDLTEPAVRAIEAHLLDCGACRVLVDGLRESQSVLKRLRQETVSSAALAEVRSRVLAEVRGMSSGTPWGAAAGGRSQRNPEAGGSRSQPHAPA